MINRDDERRLRFAGSALLKRKSRNHAIHRILQGCLIVGTLEVILVGFVVMGRTPDDDATLDFLTCCMEYFFQAARIHFATSFLFIGFFLHCYTSTMYYITFYHIFKGFASEHCRTLSSSQLKTHILTKYYK